MVVVVGGGALRGKEGWMRLVRDAYSIYVASKTGLTDRKRATSDAQGSCDR